MIKDSYLGNSLMFIAILVVLGACVVVSMALDQPGWLTLVLASPLIALVMFGFSRIFR